MLEHRNKRLWLGLGLGFGWMLDHRNKRLQLGLGLGLGLRRMPERLQLAGGRRRLLRIG